MPSNVSKQEELKNHQQTNASVPSKDLCATIKVCGTPLSGSDRSFRG